MGKCHRLPFTPSRPLQQSLPDLLAPFQQAQTGQRILKAELQAVSTNQSKLAQEIKPICQHCCSGIGSDGQGRNWNPIPGLPNFSHCGLWTYHVSLSGAAKRRGWAGWLHRSIPAWDFMSLKIASDWIFPPFWTPSPWVLCSWHCSARTHQDLECAHRLRVDPPGKHSGILFIKPGSSLIANMQWLEFWALDTLESLSTSEIGSTFTQLDRKTFPALKSFWIYINILESRKLQEWSGEVTISTPFWPPHPHFPFVPNQ